MGTNTFTQQDELLRDQTNGIHSTEDTALASAQQQFDNNTYLLMDSETAGTSQRPIRLLQGSFQKYSGQELHTSYSVVVLPDRHRSIPI